VSEPTLCPEKGDMHGPMEYRAHWDDFVCYSCGRFWTREFMDDHAPTLTDAEADRLLAAIRTAPPIPSKPTRGKT
jgi:hypothetical protein